MVARDPSQQAKWNFYQPHQVRPQAAVQWGKVARRRGVLTVNRQVGLGARLTIVQESAITVTCKAFHVCHGSKNWSLVTNSLIYVVGMGSTLVSQPSFRA